MPMMKAKGLTLLEVLIALVIIMFGVLGIAGMQMMAITNTENARYQSVAAALASSLSARMQANKAFWSIPPASVTIADSDSTNVTIVGVSNSTTDCASVACTPAAMAFFDLQEWGNAVVGALPAASVAITCPINTTPAVCKVVLTWSEKNIGLTNLTGTETGALASGTVNAGYTYQTLVSIPS